MAIDRQRQIEDLYRAALERPPAERRAFIASRSAGDEELRDSVEALLTRRDETELHRSPIGIAAGTLIGPFRVDGVLAEGGMGVVCTATDTTLHRRVAIKFLSEALFDAEARRRFEREAQMASSLNHPHILTVYAAGEHDGRQYIVTEYVDGGTLLDWMQRRSVSGWRQSVELLIGVADALAVAHGANILHRDIKPANILVSQSGYAKLADFGLAKSIKHGARHAPHSTRAGVVLGTVAYMSPEQAAGGELDARSDIFSFGIVLYEVLAGHRPFGGATDLELLQNAAHSAPAPLPGTVPEALRAIVEKAIEKDPDERYQTMRDFVVDLRRVARRSGETAPQWKLGPSEATASATRSRWAAAALVTVLALGAFGVGTWVWQSSTEPPPPRTATTPAATDLGAERSSNTGREASGAPTAAGDTPSAGVLPNSVAVLPFDNLSPNENDAYFAAGIHAEVISQLMKLGDLTVIPRTSVARYTGTSLTVPQVAAELKVQSVLGATVRYADDRVRLAAELVDGSTGAPLWAEVYERDLADLFAIQADIAMNIANALQAEFSPAEQQALTNEPTSSPEAYALYVQAAGLVAEGTQGANDVAQTLLDRAIAIDPEFGPAYGAKASLYAQSFNNSVLGAGVPLERQTELEALVREHAERAFAFDPADADARAALRTMNIWTWNWSAFRRMVEPRDEAELSAAAVWVFAWMGDHAEAQRIARKAVDLTPNGNGVHFQLGVVHAYAGDRAAADRSFNDALKLTPAFALPRAWLAYNAIAAGDAAAALGSLQLVEQLLGEPSLQSIAFLPELAYAYARIGRDADARRLFGQIQSLARTADVGTGTWALAYLAVGDEDEALRQLEAVAAKAVNHEPEQGLLGVMNLKMNFLGDPRIEEPRFADVLRRIRGN